MSAPYDPSLLTILDTLTRPGIDGFRAEVYRYGDGTPKVRFARLTGKGEWRKVDAFNLDDLFPMIDLCGPARTALALRSAPAPAPAVDPRVAQLEAEIAALRSAMSVPVPAPTPAPAPVAAPVPTPAPAPKRIRDAVRTETAIHPVAAARSALGV